MAIKCGHKMPKLKAIEDKLKKWMQYSFYIRLLVEELIAVFISSVVNISSGIMTTWGEIFSYALSIIMIVSKFQVICIDNCDNFANFFGHIYFEK